MAALFWLLLVFGTLLSSKEASEAVYQKGVELVLNQLHSHVGVQHHFLFFRSVGKSEIESGFGARYLFHHFLLKATRCAKGTTEATTLRCPFRNDRPLMDCAVCYKTFQNEIESEPKPYLHCIQKLKLTQGMIDARMDHCRRMSYTSGAPSLLAVTKDN